jgi:hypothetical protein
MLTGLFVFLFIAIVAHAAPVTTATLHVTPSLTAPAGSTVKFSADIYNNQAFPHPPGSIIRVWVTRNDFSWVSDKKDIEYPGMGSVHVNFSQGFMIPGSANAGQVYDFVLVYGIWYPISNTQSVTVTGQRFKRKEILKRKLVPIERY